MNMFSLKIMYKHTTKNEGKMFETKHVYLFYSHCILIYNQGLLHMCYILHKQTKEEANVRYTLEASLKLI